MRRWYFPEVRSPGLGAVFSAFPPDTSWRLPLGDIDRFLADSIPQDRPHLDPTPGAHRRPDLVEASAWRFRPDPEDMAAARLRRVMAIERSAWLNG